MLDQGEKRAIFAGAIIGALSGSLLAVLYRRRAQQRPAGAAKPDKTGQWVRFGVSLIPVFRQFLELIS